MDPTISTTMPEAGGLRTRRSHDRWSMPATTTGTIGDPASTTTCTAARFFRIRCGGCGATIRASHVPNSPSWEDVSPGEPCSQTVEFTKNVAATPADHVSLDVFSAQGWSYHVGV